MDRDEEWLRLYDVMREQFIKDKFGYDEAVDFLICFLSFIAKGRAALSTEDKEILMKRYKEIMDEKNPVLLNFIEEKYSIRWRKTYG